MQMPPVYTSVRSSALVGVCALINRMRVLPRSDVVKSVEAVIRATVGRMSQQMRAS